MSTKHVWRRTVLATALTAGVLPTHAQNAATLPEVEVRANAERVTEGAIGENYVAKEASVGVLGDRSLLDTPFSINVIKRDLLEAQQATYIDDALKHDASVGVTNVPVGFFTLRGFGIATDGILYDGLSGHDGLVDGRGYIEHFDRLEVLKGVGSFLYGGGNSASLGGSVNYIPHFADRNVRSLTASYTTESLFGIHGDFGQRFGASDQFGYRINVTFKDGEQAADNYDWGQKAASLALNWRPIQTLSLNAVFDYADNHLDGLPPLYMLAPGLEVPHAPDASRNSAQPWDQFHVKSRSAYLRGDWEFAQDWSLTAQFLSNTHNRPPVPFSRFGIITSADGDAITGMINKEVWENRTNTGQVLVHGKARTGALRHELTFGISASRTRERSARVNLVTFPTNIYDPVDYPEPALPDVDSRTTGEDHYSSILAADTIHFNDQWSVMLGVRRSRATQEGFDSASAVRQSSVKLERNNPLAALMFKPSANALLYAAYGEGIEQGQAGPLGSDNGPPMETRQKELGGKLFWDKLALTAALFDMQQPLRNTALGGERQGEQRHVGIEFSATGQVTKELSVVAGLMLLDPEIEGSSNSTANGNDPVGVPRRVANLWASYKLPAPGWSVNGGVYHMSGQYVDDANTQKTDSWTRLDLGARYDGRLGGKKATYLLTVENVADHDYWVSAQSGFLTIGNPRTLKASVKVDF